MLWSYRFETQFLITPPPCGPTKIINDLWVSEDYVTVLLANQFHALTKMLGIYIAKHMSHEGDPLWNSRWSPLRWPNINKTTYFCALVTISSWQGLLCESTILEAPTLWAKSIVECTLVFIRRMSILLWCKIVQYLMIDWYFWIFKPNLPNRPSRSLVYPLCVMISL
jgi:hypothetical protein